MTALMYAARYGHIECMKYLISAGANSEEVLLIILVLVVEYFYVATVFYESL